MPTYHVPEKVAGTINTYEGEQNFSFAEGDHRAGTGTKAEIALEHLVSIGLAKRTSKSDPTRAKKTARKRAPKRAKTAYQTSAATPTTPTTNTAAAPSAASNQED